ncbi:phosphatase PAP2 family protein [Streptomyces sp. NPDC001904]|uniref:phosphatase PAP2 family protein n=1 Tax=Streptomyces sp. NPDC001904 TaxID=3154531 RepID=UPI0033285349
MLVSTDGLVAGDAALHTWPLTHRPPVAQSAARAVTDSGTSVWPYLITFLAGALTGATRRARLVRGAAGLAVLLVGQALRALAMLLLARPRPPRSDWATHASGFSLPSGHTTTSALTAGVVCWALARCLHHTLARCLRVLAVVWAICVALTRVYLGVHWMSDIVAGWLFAAAYLAFVIPALAPLEQRTVPRTTP